MKRKEHEWHSDELEIYDQLIHKAIMSLDDKIHVYRKQVDILYRDSDDRDAWSWAMHLVDNGKAESVHFLSDVVSGINRMFKLMK